MNIALPRRAVRLWLWARLSVRGRLLPLLPHTLLPRALADPADAVTGISMGILVALFGAAVGWHPARQLPVQVGHLRHKGLWEQPSLHWLVWAVQARHAHCNPDLTGWAGMARMHSECANP